MVIERKLFYCEYCKKDVYKNHTCPSGKCVQCKEDTTDSHRCNIVRDKYTQIGDDGYPEVKFNMGDGKGIDLVCYDIETTGDYNDITDLVDEYGMFKQLGVEVLESRTAELKCCYVYAKNVFTGEEYEFTNMEDFISLFCKKKTILLAHNGSGFDSRFVFQSLINNHRDGAKLPEVVPRGTKFIQIKYGKAIFRDSMLHLPGSLKANGKAFNLSITKDYFPHLFNTPSNLHYVGPIPEKKYFDMGLMGLNRGDIEDFNEWYDSVKDQEWDNFKILKDYCKNDVEMLVQCVRIYHNTNIELLESNIGPYLAVSPWMYPTVAGWAHNLNNSAVVENKLEDDWISQTPMEYYFSKKALRGGMTFTVVHHYVGSINYKDICSSYPNEQLNTENLYPIGIPEIRIYNPLFYPCTNHYSEEKNCRCNYEFRKRSNWKREKIVECIAENLNEEVLKYHGFMCVDIDPPKNVLIGFLCQKDPFTGKSVATLNTLNEYYCTSAELHKAISCYGYNVLKIHRIDSYRMSSSMWAKTGVLKCLYKSKVMNSEDSSKMSDERKQYLIDGYLSRFNIDLSNDIENFVNNKTKKNACKPCINSMWGKHVENPDRFMDTLYLDDDQTLSLLTSTEQPQIRVTRLKDNLIMATTKQNRKITNPDLHNIYAPAGIFVPAYGRISLYKMVYPIMENVIAADTDCIWYKSIDPDPIPEGSILGDWESEGKNISKWVALASKSYCYIDDNGENLKNKGVSKKFAHSNILNYDNLLKCLKEGKVLEVPQFTMNYNHLDGMKTKVFNKLVKFNPSELKGVYDKNSYRLYPHGYSGPCVLCGEVFSPGHDCLRNQ